MLLRLHYIYEKSPKKCRELEEVIKDLQQCLQFDDAGVKPVRASSRGPGSCLYALNLGEDNSTVLG